MKSKSPCSNCKEIYFLSTDNDTIITVLIILYSSNKYKYIHIS